MQKKKLLFSAIVVCLIIFGAAAFYLYQKPRSGLANTRPDYVLSAKDLYLAFQKDEKSANEKFVGKVIRITGIVDNVQVTDSVVSILLSSEDAMGGVNCSVAKSNNKEPSLPAKSAAIAIKGRCVGFLMDVNLVDAIIED